MRALCRRLRFQLLTAALLGWTAGALGQSTAGATPLDRTQYGTEAVPLWSPLDTFQRYALSLTPAAHRGDGDALLALYLLASGESITLGEFRDYNTNMDAWLAQLPLSDQPKRGRRDAERLFIEMHVHYLNSTFLPNARPANYRESQSQLTAILRDGEFNCISSAMLYLTLARKLEFDVQGVVLPSHAFVQLRLADETIEIETTAYNGFDTRHDERYYKQEDRSWFNARELAPPTWEEYLNRDIVSAFDLGVFNMSNQHAETARMPYAGRMRLAELRAHLQPFDQDAQKQRLSYYYEEYVRLRDADDYPTLARLYAQTGTYLDSLSDWQFFDPEASVVYTAVQVQRTDTLIRTGNADDGLALARQLLFSRRFEADAEPVLRHLYSTINYHSRQLAEAGAFDEGRQVYAGFETRCVAHDVCNAGLARLYGLWAQARVDEGDWEAAADVVSGYLLLSDSGAAAEHFQDSLQSIYLNWASQEEYNGEWEVAMGLLNRCNQTLQQATQCERALEALEAQRDAGYL